MFSTTEKTTKPAPAIQQKAADTAFFKKVGEKGFFGTKENATIFNAPVQAKLKVSSPDDPQEKEADAVAEQVMRMPEPVMDASSISERKEERLSRKKEEEVQAKQEPAVAETIQADKEPAKKLSPKLAPTIQRLAEQAASRQETLDTSRNTDTVINQKNSSLYSSDVVPRSGRGPPNNSILFEQTLAASKGEGSAIPVATRHFMESRFHADFSGVRIHTGAKAEHLSRSIQAQAFAHGTDIYFNQGKFSPDSVADQTLLAHELTHTIQQDSLSAKNKIAPQLLPPTHFGFSSNFAATDKTNSAYINRKENNTLSRAPAPPASGPAPPGSIDLSGKSGGSTLPGEVKEFLQDYFQTSVDDIRIHLDSEATALCQMLRVPAFTQGRHICFNPSRYAPETEAGGLLLAKQVAESFSQRSIKIAGGMGSLNAAAPEAKKEEQARPATPKPARQEAGLTKKKDKKKKADKEGKSSKSKKSSEGTKGKGKRDKGDTVSGKTVKNNPNKSPSSPDEDPAFQQVVSKTKATAKKQKQHDPAEAKATDAQKAAPAAPKEAESKAQNRKTDGMEEAGKNDRPFDEKSFKADLLKKIESITPQTLEEVTEFKENNKVGEVKSVMGEKVSQEKQAIAGPVTQAAEQPLQVNEADNKKPIPLPPTSKGALPAGPGAQEAAPKPKLPHEISLQEQSKSLDDEMKANNITEEQLIKSKEPSFSAALAEKKAAQKDAVEKPLQYRKQEVLLLNQAKASAQGESARSLGAMHGARAKNFSAVVQHQETTKQKDQERRATVAKDIQSKYTAAESLVKAALEAADTESNRIFEEGSEVARKEFENYVAARMNAYKSGRYSGFLGGLRWAKDKIFGMPDEVNVFYTKGRQLYLAKMEEVITQVAQTVTAKLNEAKQAIQGGKKAIDDYVNQLPKDLADVGKEAASEIQTKFEALEQSVNSKRDELIEGLAKKYVDNVKKLDDRISEMKEANQGYIDKALGALKKVWQVIKDLTNLFTTIFAKLAAIIGVVLSDPGGFFSNLGKAFSLGFNTFKEKFLGYFEQGLMDWLKTNLGIAGIELPNKFDPAALFGLALQVMGITKDHIRERAVELLGKRKVELLEAGGGLLYKIYQEGFGALWAMIYEKLRDFKDIVWEAIKSFIQTKIIEEAIKFLLSLLSPVGAFVKVCLAIYDFLMMLVRFKDRIIELLDTILNAVTSIASGDIGGAAKAIEGAFAKSIPVIIGFLAALLHLNDIAAKVRGIIMRVKNRVKDAIDWVLKKAVGLVKGAGTLGKKAVGTIAGWLGIRKQILVKEGETHTLYFNAENKKLMMASTPVVFGDFLNTLNIPSHKQEKLNPVKARLITRLQAIDIILDNTTLSEQKKTTQVEAALNLIGPDIADLIRQTSGTSLKSERPQWGSTHGGFGSSMRVRMVDGVPASTGSQPSVTGGHWDILRKRQTSARLNDTFYIRAHLLNDNLGGPGDDWQNLSILTQRSNNRDWYGSGSHETAVESRLKGPLSEPGKGFIYVVTASYGRSVDTAFITLITSLINHKNSPTSVVAPSIPSNLSYLNNYSVATLNTLIQVITAEQFVPTSFVCTIQEIDPVDGKIVESSDHNINRAISNDISGTYYISI